MTDSSSEEPVDEAWAVAQARMDAVVAADFAEFHDRHYRRLPARVVDEIEALYDRGVGLQEIAEQLNARRQRPIARREDTWTGFMVRVVLAVAGDPALRALLVHPTPARAA